MDDVLELDTVDGDKLLQRLRRTVDRTRAGEATIDALDVLGDAIYAIDADGEIQYVNRACERLLSPDREELIGDHVSAFLPPESIRDAESVLRTIREEPDRNQGTFEFVSNQLDGEQRFYDTRITVLTDSEGQYCGSMGVIRDVTDRRNLESSRRPYERIFENLREGLILVERDEQGRPYYSDLNQAASHITGIERDEFIGSSPNDIFPTETAEHLEQLYRDLFENKTSREIYHKPKMPDGTIVTHSRLQVIEGLSGELQLLILIRDVTELARTQRDLEQDRKALRKLYDIAGRRGLALDDKLQQLLQIGCERLDLPYGFVTDIEAGTHRVVTAVGDHPAIQNETTDLENTLCRKTLEQDDMVVYRDIASELSGEEHAHTQFGLNCYIGAQLRARGELEGTICFMSKESRERPFDEAHRTFVRLLAAWIGGELEREAYLEAIEQKARTDSLTKLPNREEVIRALEEELERARRHDHDVTFLLIDLDHFKRINDQYGHWIGDEVLRAIGILLQEETRTSDVAGRYGGEEFAVVVPHADLEGATRLAQRITDTLRDRTISTEQGDVEITCSVGVTQYQGTEDDAKAIVKRADRALYRAKEEGRDRVVTSST